MKAIPALKFVESYKNVNLLTCEGRIIAFLIEKGQSSPKEIVSGLNYSNSSIVSKIKILHTSGIIKKSSIESDKLVKYEINPQILCVLEDFQLNLES